MGYLDIKENFTVDEILSHQSEIEQDFKEMDKRILDSTEDPELIAKIEQIQKTDFEAVARHDIRTLLEKDGVSIPNDSKFQKMRDAREAQNIRRRQNDETVN